MNIAKDHQPHSAIIADTLSLPHPNDTFDFVISIAVIHHFSTPERRVQAIRAVLDMIKRPGKADQAGRLLIFVWALEQKTSRRGWDSGDQQDVMVPWVRKDMHSGAEGETFNRYYHLYQAGELEQDIANAGGSILESGYERDNWWAIATTTVEHA